MISSSRIVCGNTALMNSSKVSLSRLIDFCSLSVDTNLSSTKVSFF